MPKYLSGNCDVYMNVVERFEKYIRLGVLAYGDKLPSVRTVAEDMGINPNTVQRAYVHLEEMNLVRAVPKKGVYVIYGEAKNSDPVFDAIATLKGSGISKEKLLKIVSEVYDNDQY